jgi:hypothetical protein
MTSLLVGTFVFGGLHTLLWLPRAIQMRRELRGKSSATKEKSNGNERPNKDDDRDKEGGTDS